jgi:hypothetical protein
MPECRFRNDKVDYREECRCRTNFLGISASKFCTSRRPPGIYFRLFNIMKQVYCSTSDSRAWAGMPGVTLCITSSMDLQDVSPCTTSSVDVQYISLSIFAPPAEWMHRMYSISLQHKQDVSLCTTSSMDVQGVSFTTDIPVDARGVSISTASNVYVQGVSLSTTSNVDVQGVSLSTMCECAGCIPFYHQQYECAGCVPFHLQGASFVPLSSF